MDLNLVDEVIVQVYRDDLAVFENDLYNSGFYDLRDRLPVAIGLYTGPFLKEKSAQILNREIQTVQTAGYSGVAFFCWETTLKQLQGLSSRLAP